MPRPSHNPLQPLTPRQYADLGRTAQIKASQALVYAHKHLTAELSAAERLAQLEDQIETAAARLASIESQTVTAKHADTLQARREVTAYDAQLRVLEARRAEIDAMTDAVQTSTCRAEEKLARAQQKLDRVLADIKLIDDAYTEAAERIKRHWRGFVGRRDKLKSIRQPTRDLIAEHDEKRIYRALSGDPSVYVSNIGRAATRRAS